MIEVFKIKDSFLVKGLSGKFVVNGEEFTFSYEPTVIPEPKTIARKHTRQVITHYSSLEGDVSPEKFNEIKDGLLRGWDAEDREWDSLENEFTYKKFMAQYTAFYKEVEELVPLDFQVVHFGESDNPFITPLRMLGDLRPLYSLNSNPTELFKFVGDELGFKQGKGPGYTWEGSSHTLDTAYYFKVNDTFFSNNTRFKRIAVGTWEECIAAHQFNFDLVRGFFLKQIAIIENKPLQDRAGVIKELDFVLDRLNEVIPTRKTDSAYSAAKTRIKNLINSLI